MNTVIDQEKYNVRQALRSILGASDVGEDELTQLVGYVIQVKNTFTEIERDRCAQIVGVHESPHTKSNCKLCLIEKTV
jgi:hypothetical protein